MIAFRNITNMTLIIFSVYMGPECEMLTYVTYQMHNMANHGNDMANCSVRQSRIKYEIDAVNTYVTATGRIFRIPTTVRHLPETNSTTSTKLTTATVIEANPIMTRKAMYMAKDVEKASRVPVVGQVCRCGCCCHIECTINPSSKHV